MEMRFLPDEPIQNELEDSLGFKDFVELIQRSLYHTETPFVYGVLGDWGTGKTSILRLLESRLKHDLDYGAKAYVPIWFNAWQYESEANLIYPLLYAIKTSYAARVGGMDKTREFGQVFLKLAATSALMLTDFSIRAASKALVGEAIGLKDVKEQLDAVEQHPSEIESVFSSWADRIAQLHSVFQTLLETYAADLARKDNRFKAEDVRFVILIDDLDRCLPDTTIGILESIKNHLSVPGSIFVFGLNARVIYQGIANKYKGIGVDGREYLEKILNYTFYVPVPELDKVRDFASNRIEDLVDAEDKSKFNKHFRDFGEVLEECDFKNPRKIKRMLNRYLLFLAQHEQQLQQYFMPNIVRLITIAEYFPTIFQAFLSDADKARGDIDSVFRNAQKIGQFEDTYGIKITDIYPQMLVMRKLFALSNSHDKTQVDLQQQVKDVFSLTRLV